MTISSTLIYDRIMNANPQEAGKTLMRIIDTLQSHSVNDQIIAASCLFTMLYQRYGLSPSDLIAASTNLLSDAKEPTLKAAREYINHEWVNP